MKSEYNKGYIKLWRNFAHSDWWNNRNDFRLMIVLLLNANWEDRLCNGIEIKRGSLLTSIRSLAKMSSLSIQETRTSLKHLKETNVITIDTTGKATHRFSIVTIVNYDFWQGEYEKPTHLTAHDATEKATLNEEDFNNLEEDYKNNSVVDFNELLSVDEIHRLHSQYDKANDLIDYVQDQVNSKGLQIKVSAYKYICAYAENKNWTKKEVTT